MIDTRLALTERDTYTLDMAPLLPPPVDAFVANWPARYGLDVISRREVIGAVYTALLAGHVMGRR